MFFFNFLYILYFYTVMHPWCEYSYSVMAEDCRDYCTVCMHGVIQNFHSHSFLRASSSRLMRMCFSCLTVLIPSRYLSCARARGTAEA